MTPNERTKRILDIISGDCNTRTTPWVPNINGEPGTMSCFLAMHWRGITRQKTIVGRIYAGSVGMMTKEEMAAHVAELQEEIAAQIERVLYGILSHPLKAGLEPHEVFESDLLETWLRDRGWIHE